MVAAHAWLCATVSSVPSSASNQTPVKDHYVIMHHPINGTRIVGTFLDINVSLSLHREYAMPTRICVELLRLKTPVYEEPESTWYCDEVDLTKDYESEISRHLERLNKRVELKVSGEYHFTISLYDVEDTLLEKYVSIFYSGPSPKCLDKLKQRSNPITTLTEYNRNEYTSLAGGTTQLFMSPLCAEEYASFMPSEGLHTLPTHSAFRGSFGVDFTSMEFGHGDLMMINFVLVRYPTIKHIVELGTFAGITSFHWGIAAGLRGGELHSFDIVDNRIEAVKGLWALNQKHMKFFLADVNANPMDKQMQQSSAAADLLFVDADSRTRMEQAVRSGSLMSEGSVIIVHDFPGRYSVFEWVKTLANIGFAYNYHDIATGSNVVSSVGIFERKASVLDSISAVCLTTFRHHAQNECVSAIASGSAVQ